MDPNHWNEILRPTYQGRKFIIATDVLAGVGRTIDRLRGLGAERPFVIAAARGTGEVPAPADAEVAMVMAAGGSHMAWLRNVEAVMHDLPASVMARIDTWDPNHEARVLGPFLFSNAPVARRPMYGGRPGRFISLEDKLVIDDAWDRAFVPRAPVRVAHLADDALGRIAAELDWGSGTVWVGDTTRGWHGGAEVLRWVAGPHLAGKARDFLVTHAERVRIMPFLEGIPCSIHGIVIDDDVVVVRPIEMLVMRRREVGIMTYVGTATFYDPPEDIATSMRGVASRVGELLRREVEYSGAFTVDGVASELGFLPTELNPRLGAGLFRAVRSLEQPWLLGLQRALVEGEQLDYRPRELERVLVAEADANRNGVAFVMINDIPDQTTELHLAFDGGEPSRVDAAGADATAEWGPGTNGGALTLRFNSERTPIGPSIAARAAAALRVAGDHLGIEIPEYEPARDVHRSRAP